MSLTTDPNDPRLSRGPDKAPGPQNEVYLVLSEEERAKGFVRPLRRRYQHVGILGPRYPVRDLTPEEQERFGAAFGAAHVKYVKYEAYPESETPLTGRYWTQAQLDSVGKGCGAWTTMADAIAETYARRPGFYGATYCCTCGLHLPVGEAGEFVWEDGSRVGS